MIETKERPRDDSADPNHGGGSKPESAEEFSEPSPQERIQEKLQLVQPDVLELRNNLQWLIRLRWTAIVCITVCLLIAYWLEWTQTTVEPLVVTGMLSVFNYRHWRKSRGLDPEDAFGHLDAKALIRGIVGQLHIDLLALTLVLHWTGRVENPFSVLYVFPVALASILLPLRSALLVCLSAFLMYSALIGCQAFTASANRPFLSSADFSYIGNHKYPLLKFPSYILATAAAMGTTLLGIVYFLQTVIQERRRSEARRREHERIARSRERLARVGTIAAGLAHSVRNPLHGLLNCVDLLEDQDLGPDGHSHLGLMKEGLERIEEVMNRLLTMTRDTPISIKSEDINRLVADTQRLIESRPKAEAIEIRRRLDPFLPHIPLDSTRFDEALYNIIDNAADALGPVGGKIILRTYKCSLPLDGVCVEVVDNGTGIAKSDIESIFDPFYTSKAIGEGTGLGLSIARSVIEEHGGVLEVRSIPGKGTIMRIFLPSKATNRNLEPAEE